MPALGSASGHQLCCPDLLLYWMSRASACKLSPGHGPRLTANKARPAGRWMRASLPALPALPPLFSLSRTRPMPLPPHRKTFFRLLLLCVLGLCAVAGRRCCSAGCCLTLPCTPIATRTRRPRCFSVLLLPPSLSLSRPTLALRHPLNTPRYDLRPSPPEIQVAGDFSLPSIIMTLYNP